MARFINFGIAASSIAIGMSPAAAVEPAGAFGWMADLAGHCWSATYADGTRDTQCYRLQFDRYLRGTIEIAPPPGPTERPAYRGDSVFIWRPASSEMAFHFWSNAGADGVSVGRVEGDRLVFPMLARDGGELQGRTVWSRLGPDSYRVTRQRREGTSWQDGTALTYARSGPAPAGE